MSDKIIHDKGYILIYNPKHHKAKQNGYVYEHMIVAEIKLGRKLKDNEEVHHEDENKQNNHPDNLYVFATKADHARYHKTGKRVKVDDYWISPASTKNCEVCSGIFEYVDSDNSKYCSKKCYWKSLERVKRPTREELLELIKSKSFLQIGKDYGVSDNAVRKWCKSYGLPYRKKDIKTIDNSK